MIYNSIAWTRIELKLSLDWAPHIFHIIHKHSFRIEMSIPNHGNVGRNFILEWTSEWIEINVIDWNFLWYNSFWTEFLPFLMSDKKLVSEWNVDSESCKFGTKFQSQVFFKIRSFIHGLRFVIARTVEGFRGSLAIYESWNLTRWNFSARR